MQHSIPSTSSKCSQRAKLLLAVFKNCFQSSWTDPEGSIISIIIMLNCSQFLFSLLNNFLDCSVKHISSNLHYTSPSYKSLTTYSFLVCMGGVSVDSWRLPGLDCAVFSASFLHKWLAICLHPGIKRSEWLKVTILALCLRQE